MKHVKICIEYDYDESCDEISSMVIDGIKEHVADAVESAAAWWSDDAHEKFTTVVTDVKVT